MATTEDSSDHDRRSTRRCRVGRRRRSGPSRSQHGRRSAATGSRRLHERFCAGLPAVARPLLDSAYSRARRLDAAGGYGEDGPAHCGARVCGRGRRRTGCRGDARGERCSGGGRRPRRDVVGIRVEAARLELYRRASSATQLLELPPLVAAGVQLRLLARSRRRGGGLALAAVAERQRRLADPARRRSALAAGARGSEGRPPPAREFASSAARRCGPCRSAGSAAPYAAVVARIPGHRQPTSATYLEAAAGAVAAVLDREHLLERSAAREQALVTASERRLMRLGFDLHDGPVQDVLALCQRALAAARPGVSVHPRQPSRADRRAASTTRCCDSSTSIGSCVRSRTRSSREASSAGRSARSSTARPRPSRSARESRFTSRSAATPSR